MVAHSFMQSTGIENGHFDGSFARLRRDSQAPHWPAEVLLHIILTVPSPMVMTRLTPLPSKPGTILAVTGSPTAPLSASELAGTAPLAMPLLTGVKVKDSVPAGASADEQLGHRFTSA